MLPPIASLPLPRNSAAASATGAETLLQSPGAIADADSLMLSSPAGSDGLEWAVYSLAASIPGELKLDVEVEVESGEVWVGLADFAQGRWRFLGPFTEPVQVGAADPAYRSSSDSIICAVVAQPGSAVRISALALAPQAEWHSVDLGEHEWAHDITLLLHAGRPLLLFREYRYNKLLLFRSNTPLGLSAADWESRELPTATDQVCARLAIVQGRPAICYARKDSLHYAISQSFDGLQGEWTEVSFAEPKVNYCALAEIAGCPAIAFQDHPRDLIYMSSRTALGTSVGDWRQTLVDTPYLGREVELMEYQGRPAIAHLGENFADIWLAFSTTATGAKRADWQVVGILPGTNPGTGFSFTIVDRLPVLLATNLTANTLRYIDCPSGELFSAPAWQEVHVSDCESFGNSLALIAGRPACAFQSSYGDLSNAVGFSALVAGAGPPSWSAPLEVSVPGNVGNSCALAEVRGFPAVVYRSDGKLYYAIRH